MKKQKEQGIRRMLDLCDELGKLRRRLSGLERSGNQRNIKSLRTREEEVRLDLSRLELKGPLGEVAKEAGTDQFDHMILAALLRQYLKGDTPYLEGRILLNQLFQSSYEVLTGVARLDRSSPLGAAGLIEEEDEGELDALDQRWRITEKAISLVNEEMNSPRRSTRPGNRVGYSRHAEFLADMKILVDLLWARTSRVFDWEEVSVPAPGRWNPGSAMTRRLRREQRRINSRLANTNTNLNMPFIGFCQRFDLSFAEQMVVLALLFHELHEGTPYLDVVDLIKLVSSDEQELIRNRRLFWKRNRLRRSSIVHFDDLEGERWLSAETRLGDWVLPEVLGNERDELITADEQLDFHLFLKRLDSSGPFFQGMEE